MPDVFDFKNVPFKDDKVKDTIVTVDKWMDKDYTGYNVTYSVVFESGKKIELESDPFMDDDLKFLREKNVGSGHYHYDDFIKLREGTFKKELDLL